MAEGKDDKDQHGSGSGSGKDEKFQIQIDRATYTVHKEKMSGLEIRHVPTPPIDHDRDLFEVIAGGTDKKIEDGTVVEIHHGIRFFTAPAHINPGK